MKISSFFLQPASSLRNTTCQTIETRPDILSENQKQSNPLRFNRNISGDICSVYFNVHNSKKPLSFRGIPQEIPYFGIYDAKDAIRAFDYLKLGNYLDCHDDDICPEHKNIRRKNLKFLDSLYSDEQKREFVEYYKQTTGFPDLAKVSEKIEAQFISAIKQSEIMNNSAYKCIAAGYDASCSVGKGMAFPGSDLDKAFVIIQGTSDDDENLKIVEHFKKSIWEKTDQRILSFNHDTSFPNIYTVKQIKDLLYGIDLYTGCFVFNKDEVENNLYNECFDLEKAGLYNVIVSKGIPQKKYGDKYTAINKDNVKDFAFFIESLRDGKLLITSPEVDQLKEDIQDYNFYKYSNVAHLKGMKTLNQNGNQKNKIKNRILLQKEFNHWCVDQQMKLVKALIQYSCEDNENFDEYFKNEIDMKQRYKTFLALLTRGSNYTYFKPTFIRENDGVIMQYDPNNRVALYPGYTQTILWIDSRHGQDINETIRNLDKIKVLKQFNKIASVQCPEPYDEIDGFTPTNFLTADGSRIYMRIIR